MTHTPGGMTGTRRARTGAGNSSSAAASPAIVERDVNSKHNRWREMRKRTCDWTFAILFAGKVNSFKGTFASFRYRRNPSSLGSKNIKLFPTLPARAVRPTR